MRNSNASDLLKDKDIVLYRLAGFLHDIGHYPFSHAMENAVKKFFRDKLIIAVEAKLGRPENDYQENDTDKFQFFNYEKTGEQILANDAELCKIFQDGSCGDYPDPAGTDSGTARRDSQVEGSEAQTQD